MEGDRLLSASFDDKLAQCKNDCVITFTKFLDIRQQGIFLSRPKDKDAVALLFGGYASAERKIGVFVPKLYNIGTEEEYFEYDGGEPLRAVRIVKDKFSVLSHRDYLGALMSLGIKRETVGDIIPDKDGASVVVFREIAPHIIRDLDRIGRGSCVCRELALTDIEKTQIETREIFATVPSLRLDNIVSAAFGISRKLAAEAIEQKKVFVDGVPCEKADRKISAGSKIVLHGMGKAVFQEQNGVSRKDRQKIVIKRYV
ncbi:MAG: RNA-binding protein [Acutalibacteraceae bacterium]